MPSSTSGLLLLLIGVTVLAGFLTGNLDRWISYLFDPSHPSLSALAAPAQANAIGTGVQAGERRA